MAASASEEAPERTSLSVSTVSARSDKNPERFYAALNPKITDSMDPRGRLARCCFPCCAVFAWQGCDKASDNVLATLFGCCFTCFFWKPDGRQKKFVGLVAGPGSRDHNGNLKKPSVLFERLTSCTLGPYGDDDCQDYNADGSPLQEKTLCGCLCHPKDRCCRFWCPVTSIYAWQGCERPLDIIAAFVLQSVTLAINTFVARMVILMLQYLAYEHLMSEVTSLRLQQDVDMEDVSHRHLKHAEKVHQVNTSAKGANKHHQHSMEQPHNADHHQMHYIMQHSVSFWLFHWLVVLILYTIEYTVPMGLYAYCCWVPMDTQKQWGKPREQTNEGEEEALLGAKKSLVGPPVVVSVDGGDGSDGDEELRESAIIGGAITSGGPRSSSHLSPGLV